MTIDTIITEVYYYLGIMISVEEAAEILDLYEDCPGAALDEVVKDYYNC